MHSNRHYKLYHPNPFQEKPDSAVRGDCEPRYKAIKENIILDNDFTVLDFGCAEGYIGFRFLQDGASFCHFIDNDTNCLDRIKEIASENSIMDKITTSTKMTYIKKFSVALLLDLWSEKGVPSLDDFAKVTDQLFVSTSGNGSEKNMKLLADASHYFDEVVGIYTGYQNRTIYRCTNKVNQAKAA